SYGADAARLFMLSDSPPERDLEWTDAGIDGAWRYINRIWKLVGEHKDALKGAKGIDLASIDDAQLLSLRKATHKTIAAITDDIEKFHFNKCIARIRELTNLLGDAKSDTPQSAAVFYEAISAALHLMCPFLPHLAEELWAELGGADLLSARPWPKADAQLAADNVVTIAVQINGKLKATIDLPRDAGKDATEQQALALPPVAEALKGKTIVKTVVVPGRIVNVVAK
ncbi:MAG: leucine--tRNA ligase, partial [Alphaproteobacteria bacterium]|nr:leucine--tRNA ligase [Alphaproteobacteria bacterium]